MFYLMFLPLGYLHGARCASILSGMTDSLGTCPLGREIEICRIDVGERYRFRLGELGLREHQRLRVIQKTSFGGCVLAKGRERMALDGATARHILVVTR